MYRITQAYVSQSVADFDWFKRFNLLPYHDRNKPALFIGMYSESDLKFLKKHKNKAIVKWCGYDSMMVKNFRLFKKPHIKNITVHPNVFDRLKSLKINCELVKLYSTNENIYQGISGDSVFAYCPPTLNNYHRTDLIRKLRKEFSIIKGDGKIPQHKWHDGKKYKYYNQCYIGLVLNDYAGGVGTITELLLQGKYCITNAARLPNCLHWETLDDIRNHLNNPKYKQPDFSLAANNDFFTFEPEWLTIEI